MLLRWAARQAALTGRSTEEVLREAGILDARSERALRDREVPLTTYLRNRKGRSEQED